MSRDRSESPLLVPFTDAPGILHDKRKADAAFYALPNDDYDDESSEDPVIDISLNCDQIRSMIKRHIGSGEITVERLQDALGVSPQAYARFMDQDGENEGDRCKTYERALRYFVLPSDEDFPREKRKKADTASLQAISAIRLDGEADASVPVYDTCTETRRKISSYLDEPGVTQAAFLREIATTYPSKRVIQSKQLHDFLRQEGPYAGNTSSVYYASYVFFEKLRIKNGDPKSENRKNLEATYPDGLDRKSIRRLTIRRRLSDAKHSPTT